MTHKMMVSALALMALSAPASAQELDPADPTSWVVERGAAGQPLGYEDPVLVRRRDFGGPDAPLGYGASENYSLWQGAFAQNWSYGVAPMQWHQAAGDGGQIISIDGTTAAFWATQDGSFNGMQYFLGPSCGGQGWVLFDTSRLEPYWVSEIDSLAISKVSPTTCQPLGSSLTRWMEAEVILPTQVAGVRSNDQGAEAILTEHYDYPSQGMSQNMERNFFVLGLGNVYWQAWSRSVQPGNDLAERCPEVTVNGYYVPEDGGWHLVECRYYMNFTLAPPGFTEVMYGWPYGY